MRSLTEREFTWGIWIVTIIAVIVMAVVFGPDNGREMGWRWDF